MFTPNNDFPTTLEEMKTFLTPCITNGLFTALVFDDDSNPTELRCFQGEDQILDITVNFAGWWTFKPYTADGVAADASHKTGDLIPDKAYRCKDGVAFFSEESGDARYAFVIAKTSSGKTGFINVHFPTSYYGATATRFYPVCFGDNTATWVYTQGYYIACNTAGADRTILTPLPVPGGTGSTDKFTGVFVRNAVQFSDNGEQIIGGKKYGCAYIFAMGDAEEV